jgi:hypothetical protein
LHSDKAYVGLSIPNFIESNRYDDDNKLLFLKKKINYYLIAGYILDLNSSIKFKPALLTKMVKGAPLQVDVSGNFMFNDKFVLRLLIDGLQFYCNGWISNFRRDVYWIWI